MKLEVEFISRIFIKRDNAVEIDPGKKVFDETVLHDNVVVVLAEYPRLCIG